MREKDLMDIPTTDGRVDPLLAEVKRRKLTVVTARVGVWGVIGGLGGVILASVIPGVGLLGASLGFLAGGLGVIGTSLLVLRDAGKASMPLRLAAVVGLPFGGSLSLLALGLFLGFSLPGGLMRLAGPGTLALGIILVLLLLVGFVSHAFSGADDPLQE